MIITIINNGTDNETFINLYFSFSNDTTNNSDINEKDIISIEELNENVFIFISLIYIGSILLSILLFYSILICCFFKKNRKLKKILRKTKKTIKIIATQLIIILIIIA